MNRRNLDPSTSPLAAFGVQLRRSREAKGLTQGQLGELLNYSGAYVSYVERAERTPPVRFAKLADDALETGGTLALMWWHLGHSSLIDGFPEYAAREAEAAAVQLFELSVVPGLLQTESYAAALVNAAAARGEITQRQADERLAFRLARQRLLYRAAAPVVHAVLDESCLRRTVGGPGVMAGQLRHLEQLARRPNVILQVAPFDLGERVPFTMPVTLLTMRSRTLLGYTETLARGFLESETEAVAGWAKAYDRLQVEALSRADSLAMVRALRKELPIMTSTDVDLSGAPWLKSSYSNGGGQCIEVAPGFDGVMPVRDSKDPEGPVLVFPAGAWQAFVAATARGEFGAV
ncbi:Scr1 family TA system antitoxin-like transcriptional regulator [Streptomyces sp. CB03911]|uniref:helix-turn-helix domain-containing protein n=1 Tax=Streptomyces sp. CB03911 TaxID=1804758 RepID=UPI00093DEA3F|nr:Scr1 family TA system antitoxin-like transcriptional regulator [Streptomyces sp. CB03911]